MIADKEGEGNEIGDGGDRGDVGDDGLDGFWFVGVTIVEVFKKLF